MSLNIKNPETHALAAELARRLETSLTEAVTIALREKLEATGREADVARRYEKMMRMAQEISAMMTPEQRAFDIDKELYDEMGLPK